MDWRWLLLPQPDPWTVARGADEFNAGCLKDFAKFKKRLRATWRNVRRSFESLDGFPC